MKLSPLGLALIATLLGAAYLAPVAAQQNDRAQAKAKLAEVRARIQGLHQRLTAARTQQDELTGSLRESEVQSAALAVELRELESNIEREAEALAVVRAREAKTAGDVTHRRKRLAQQARANYRMSLHSPVALALKQENPAALARALAYAAHLDRAQARHISALGEELNRARALEQDVLERSQAFAAMREQKEISLKKQSDLRTTRLALLAEVEADIDARNARIQQLSEDAGKLEELLAGLREELPDDFSMAAERRPFAALKGKLPWPLTGNIEHAYGESRGKKGLKWRGVIISAKAGQPVRAVYHGRVAFANWLRGFGLLTIIDHGDGYLSLYGHNESLNAGVGDWVSPGDVIAHVGDTGGARQTGLYFEIRHRGTPSDPRTWCSEDVAPADAVLVKP